MNILESVAVAPIARTTLDICSDQGASNITLSVKDAFVPKKDGSGFEVSPSRKSQLVAFNREDGQPVQLLGKVLENDAVQIAAAHRVIVEVELAPQLKAAREAGRTSASYVQLYVTRVLKVWPTKDSKPWEASPVAGLQASNGGKH